MKTKPYELAVRTTDGGWELIGEFATYGEAVHAAEEHAAEYAVDGKATFGISSDPASGHYEEAIVYDLKALEDRVVQAAMEEARRIEAMDPAEASDYCDRMIAKTLADREAKEAR